MTQATPNGWVVDRQFKVLLALIFGFGFIFPLLPPGLRFDSVGRDIAAQAGGDTSFKLLWLPLLALSIWVMAARFRWLVLFIRQVNPWLLALSVWCLASAAWAPQPAATFRQAVSISVPLFAATAFCLAAWQPERFIRVLLPALTVVLLASLVVGFLLPDVGVHSSAQFELAGSWRGITYQKNGLGQVASVGVILWTWAWASRRVSGRIALLNIALSVFLVLASRSSTSLMMSILGSGLILVLLRSPMRVERHYRGALVVTVALLLLVPLLIYLLTVGSIDFANLGQSIGAVFGKDFTFSGRTYIWAELLREIPRHLWQGIGFNAFWGGPGSPADGAIRRLGWEVPNGHNGYLDIINETGLIGFGLFVMFIGRHIADLRALGQRQPEHAALHWGLLVYVLMANLTESGWFRPIQFTHVIGVYSSLIVSRQLMEYRFAQRSSARHLAQPQGLVHD